MENKLYTTKDRNKSLLSYDVKQNKLIRVERGVYSNNIFYDLVEIYSLRYPYAIFTLATLFSLYGMTDRFIEKYHLVTLRGSRTIKDKNIIQTRQIGRTINIGKTVLEYRGRKINVYDKERLLIELFRFSNRISKSLYKEIINFYRKHVYNDFKFNIFHEYCTYFKESKMLKERFRKEIL